jgi:SAM-dependent methyltransferase
MFRHWLAHPLTRNLSVDDPKTTFLRRQIIAKKPFLRQIYEEWYRQIAAAIPAGHEPVLELGSGAGFLRDHVAGLITSDVFFIPDIDVLLEGSALPFGDATLRAIVMVDVMHHIPNPKNFLAEAARCVHKSGVLVMIEPWVTTWSRLVYGNFHHEPFDPATEEWEFPSVGPLSGANGALPWIIFDRDRARFQREFRCWEIRSIEPQMPFRYLLSGGMSLRSLSPVCTFGLWRGLEAMLQPWMHSLAMFARIQLMRT